MAFTQIAGIAPNFRDYKNDWLKAYEPGTTTPKLMSDNDTGTPTVSKYQLNADGFPVSSGGAIVIPHIDGEYDLWIFPTAAEADANDTSNALRVADDISSPGSNIGGYATYEFDTVLNAQNGITIGGQSVTLKENDVIRIEERGSALFDVISGTGSANGYDIIAHATLSLSFQLRVMDGLKKTSFYGVVGDYVPSSDTGTDNTLAMQRIYDTLEDGDHLIHVGNILIDRTSANIKTVQGVASYILVADNVSDLKVSGTGAIYQRWNETLDTVGVCFFNCDDLVFDGFTIDGNFRYTAAEALNFKQQLMHIIQGKRHTGDFTVRNSSNVGFLLSNQHGDTGGGFVETMVNNHNYGSIISSNCLQNTTFGTGVDTVSIDSITVINPIVAALKLSSRISVGAAQDIFKDLTINTLNLSFDDTWVAPSVGGLTGLDYVCAAKDVHVENMNLDFTNCTISSIGAKHVGQVTNDTTRAAGDMTIGTIVIKNQTVANSVVLEKDNESLGTYINRINATNVSKICQISNVDPSTGVQDKDKKYLYVESARIDGHDRAAFNITDWDGDYISIGKAECMADAGFTQQTMRIDSSCDVNRVDINLECNSVLTILGDVQNQIKIQGRIEVLNQAADPITISLTNQLGIFELDNLYIAGDNDAARKCQITNVARVEVEKINLRGCPLGFSLNDVSEFSISDQNQRYQDLTVLSPYQFGGVIGSIQGAFSYTGSPNSVQIASIGCSYRRRDTGQLYMKTANDGTNIGWNPLT